MKKSVLFLIVLLFPVLLWADNAKQALQIVPRTQAFPVLTTATGYFELAYPFINVTFDKLTIRNNSKNFQRIIGMRIGLAHVTEKGWEVLRWGDYFVTQRDLENDRTLELTHLSTTIPSDSLTSLQPFWLIVATETSTNRNGDIATSVSYSHSPDNIFKNPMPAACPVLIPKL